MCKRKTAQMVYKDINTRVQMSKNFFLIDQVTVIYRQ
jgi:hypothetical protein